MHKLSLYSLIILTLFAAYGAYSLPNNHQVVRVTVQQEALPRPVPLPDFQLTREIDSYEVYSGKQEYDRLLTNLAMEAN